jgi:hypothetical protein
VWPDSTTQARIMHGHYFIWQLSIATPRRLVYHTNTEPTVG